MKQIVQKSDLSSSADRLVTELRSRTPVNGATLVVLRGELGAGKTTLSQLIGEKLGVTTQMQSPTYVIMKHYETTDEIWKELVHIDAYRLKGLPELEHLGFREILKNTHTLILLEWPDRVPEILDEAHATIELSYIDEETRLLILV